MNKLVALSISTLVVALAAPLMAQSLVLKANVPFEFTVHDKTLPAGEYLVHSDGTGSAIVLQGQTAHVAALALTYHKELARTENPASITKLTFDRYGDRYFLSEVDNGFAETGYVVPASHTEREMAKTASLQREVIVAVLAQR